MMHQDSLECVMHYKFMQHFHTLDEWNSGGYISLTTGIQYIKCTPVNIEMYPGKLVALQKTKTL